MNRRTSILVLVLAIVMMNSGIIAFAQTSIHLKEAVSIGEPFVYLKDVLRSSDVPELETLLNTRICKAPEPGKTRQLSRAYITMRLKNVLKDVSAYAWDGAPYVTIERTAQEIHPEELGQYLRSFMSRRYALPEARLMVECENVKRGIQIPAGEYQITVEQTTELENGRAMVKVSILIQDKPVFERMVSVRVYEEKSVVVMKKTVRLHEEITRDHIGVHMMRISLPCTVACTEDQVIGKMAKVSLRQGETIELGVITDMPAVHKGETVTALCKEKTMSVTMTMQALSDAAIGNTVQLFIPATKKHVTGIVTSRGYVEVSLS